MESRRGFLACVFGPLAAICFVQSTEAGHEPAVKFLDKQDLVVIKDCTFHTSARAAVCLDLSVGEAVSCSHCWTSQQWHASIQP
jgi:hypothetical protein